MTDIKEPDPKDPVKRLNYFTGQFLAKEDFLAEQQYHLGLRRRGNRVLFFGPGVLENNGFVVTQLGTNQIKISSGTGLDQEGRELILVSEQIVDVPLTGGVDRVVTMEYSTQPTDEQTPGDTDHGDFTRVLEAPLVRIVAKGSQSASAIIIANLKVDTSGAVTAVNWDDRQRAKARVPGDLTIGQGNYGVLTTRHINGKHYLDDNDDDLYLNWSTGKDVHIGGNRGASLTVAGNADLQAPDTSFYGLKLSRTDEDHRAHQWALWHMNQQYGKNALQIWEYKADSSGKSCDGNPRDGAMCSVRLTIAEGGNVGIGTVTPRARLEIADGAIMPAAGNSEKAGILFPSDPGGGSGDKAWIRYYARAPRPGTSDTAERTALEIGIANDGFENLGANQDDILLMPSGGVGIGTLTPGAKLEVAGDGGSSVDLVVNGRLKSNNNDGGLWIAGDRFVGGHSTENVGFWNGNAWRLTVQANGYVGIGTTTPAATLDVQGDMVVQTLRAAQVNIAGKLALTEALGMLRLNEGGAFQHGVRIGGKLLAAGINVGGVDNAIDPGAGNIRGGGNIAINGNLGTHEYSSSPFHSTWGGGVRTWDVEAHGTIWCAGSVLSATGKFERADLAENFCSDQSLEPGDVVSIDLAMDRIVRSVQSHDRLVCGVISTAPGLILNSAHDENDARTSQLYPLALAGRVPCKVVDENGAIRRGDLLTSSSLPGHAMKLEVGNDDKWNSNRSAVILGKALGQLDSGTGLIDILVCLS